MIGDICTSFDEAGRIKTDIEMAEDDYKPGKGLKASVKWKSFSPKEAQEFTSEGRLHKIDDMISGTKLLISGKHGTVQFFFGGAGSANLEDAANLSKDRVSFIGYDLGYHAVKPMYEDQTQMTDCEYIGGQTCYYDGSGLNADKPLRILFQESAEATFAYLEEYYHSTFNHLEEKP